MKTFTLLCLFSASLFSMENKLSWFDEINHKLNAINQGQSSLLEAVKALERRILNLEKFTEEFAAFKTQQNEHRAKFEKIIREKIAGIQNHTHGIEIPRYLAISTDSICYETEKPSKPIGLDEIHIV